MRNVLPQVSAALQDVYDPCCREKGISVVDMGLLHTAAQDDSGAVRVELLLTSGWCPFASKVLLEVEDRIAAIPGVTESEVEIVWDTAWTTDRMSEAARRKLRFLPDPVQVTSRDDYLAAHPAPMSILSSGGPS